MKLSRKWLMLLFVGVLQANVWVHCVLHYAIGVSPSRHQLDVPHVSVTHVWDCVPSSAHGDGCDPNAAGAAAERDFGPTLVDATLRPYSSTPFSAVVLGLAPARAPPSIS